MLHVYLAGAVRGEHGPWRDDVPEIPDVVFMHPGAAITGDEPERRTELYGPADRMSVKKCDVLLAYCGRVVAGHGTAVEIGMALALGKEVFIVCPDEETRYVWRFAAGATPNVFSSLKQAFDVIRYSAAQVSGKARCDCT